MLCTVKRSLSVIREVMTELVHWVYFVAIVMSLWLPAKCQRQRLQAIAWAACASFLLLLLNAASTSFNWLDFLTIQKQLELINLIWTETFSLVLITLWSVPWSEAPSIPVILVQAKLKTQKNLNQTRLVWKRPQWYTPTLLFMIIKCWLVTAITYQSLQKT